MAYISVTNALNDNSATSDITLVGANFTDITDGLSDGTKDINVAAATCTSLVIDSGTLSTVVDQNTYSSTIAGFSGTPTQLVRYFKVGPLVFISFSITGTSNATTFTFTVPYASADDSLGVRFAVGSVTNNSVDAGPGMGYIDGDSSTVNLRINGAGGAWTASGTKAAIGSFVYLAAS